MMPSPHSLPTPKSMSSRRASAPPPPSSLSPAFLPQPSNGSSSRKNSSPEVGSGSAASTSDRSGVLGSLSLLGLGKKSPKNNLAQPCPIMSREYPINRDSFDVSPLKAMHEVDEEAVLDEDTNEEDDYYPELDSCHNYGLASSSSSNPGSINLSLDSLRDILKCVGCHRFLFPPILQCVSGHMECKNCFEMKSQCAKCRGKMVEVPAKFAEMITEQFKVQCSYADKGCQETVAFKLRRDHEEVCPFKPVQCPEFDCTVKKPLNEIFKHFRLEHHHHFVNAHGNVFNGDIRCDDTNMVMGVERKWAPTMMKLDGGSGNDDSSDRSEGLVSGGPSTQHFFLEILRSKHGLWHMWIWYLGEPEEAHHFKCEIAIRKKNRDEETELKYSGRVHSIRIPPHRIILSGCLLSFSDHAAKHFRYLGDGHSGHPVIDYRVSVSRAKSKKRSTSNDRAMAAGLTKMLRRFSIDSGQNKANKAATIGPFVDSDNDN